MKTELSRSYPIKVAQRAIRFLPKARRQLLIGIDTLLLPLAVWLSFWLRLAHPFHHSFQYAGSRALYRLAGRNGLLVLLLAATGLMLRLPMPPRSS